MNKKTGSSYSLFPPCQTTRVDELSTKLLELESRLDSNIPSTLWISDLHGEGDRFKSILRGRFGMLYETCKEALPKTFSDERLQYITKIVRKKSYFTSPTVEMDPEEVILNLTEIIRYKINNVRYDFQAITLPEYRDYIQRLVSGMRVPEQLFENPIIAHRLITHLAITIKRVLLDQIIVLGDIFDRGAQPDKIIRILSSPSYAPGVQLVFGNHDILWMGAAAGNRSLIAEAMRITCRYDHFKLIQRLGFDIQKLEDFAVKTYPPELATGRFKAKTNKGKSMEKALAVIQFKLEDALIKKHPEYDMGARLILPELAGNLKNGTTEGLNDSHFPTIDFAAPAQLTAEEQEVMEDLAEQFLTNKRLKRLLTFFFEQGQTYHLHNNLLNIHALIPSTAEGEFESFQGRKGKELLDWIQASIHRAGQAYLQNEQPTEDDQALFFYLWCGPKSPFFGKEAMKTFERYFNLDKNTHKEPSLYWKSNLETDGFKQKLLAEFDAKRVIFGHTPVDITKGKQMASKDGVAINVDGGFAAAYYHRGHALVHTPYQLYGVILPTPDEMEQSATTHESIPLSVEMIDEFTEPLKIKDTFIGTQLQAEAQEIQEELNQISQEL